MCPLLAQLIIGCFAATVYSTNEANKAGLKQSIFLDVYGYLCDDNGQFLFLFAKQTNPNQSNRRSMVQ
jgi:hypothetical protein